MRHRDKINHLGRKYGHRKSMLTNMAVSLIFAKRINTTVAKGKELRTFVEPILTASKVEIACAESNAKTEEEKTAFKVKRMANHRFIFSKLRDKKAVKALFMLGRKPRFRVFLRGEHPVGHGTASEAYPHYGQNP